MAVGDAHVFPGFLTPVLTQLFFPKPPTTFFKCFWRVERRKYAGKKIHFNRGSNSQPAGHESDTLTTEPSGRGRKHCEKKEKLLVTSSFFLLHCCLLNQIIVSPFFSIFLPSYLYLLLNLERKIGISGKGQKCICIILCNLVAINV